MLWVMVNCFLLLTNIDVSEGQSVVLRKIRENGSKTAALLFLLFKVSRIDSLSVNCSLVDFPSAFFKRNICGICIIELIPTANHQHFSLNFEKSLLTYWLMMNLLSNLYYKMQYNCPESMSLCERPCWVNPRQIPRRLFLETDIFVHMCFKHSSFSSRLELVPRGLWAVLISTSWFCVHITETILTLQMK